jgi:hypothetical protein
MGSQSDQRVELGLVWLAERATPTTDATQSPNHQLSPDFCSSIDCGPVCSEIKSP